MTSGAGFKVVALVASTGGLDALSRVLSPLPAGFPAAIIALQHQDPARIGHLAEILGSRTALDVHPAVNGEVLEPGHVYVAPSAWHTLVLPDRKLTLIESGGVPPSRPSGDLLFTSLAISVGTDAIAVVLSGAGRDGATGATLVHHLGGVVMASDEASSEVFSMPHETAERYDVIDYVLHLDDIAGWLLTVVEPDHGSSPD
jgi:two-component system, chemotaxis family, protein-glutamate methylesterase/glutaminase